MRKNQILKIYGTDYKEMTKTLLAAADLAGMIGDRSRRIGIKPNLVCPSPAEFGATTHPEIIAGIIEYLQENGFRNLLIAEGSWVGDRTQEAFEYCGYYVLSEQYGVPLVDTKKETCHTADCSGMKIRVTDVRDRIDFLINVPVLKGHCQTKVTCALKNMKGLLPDIEKRNFHRMGLHKPIAHLQIAVRQDFIVVDHICGDLDFEEGGNPVVRNCIMAAMDPVLTDAYACYLMQYTPDDVPYIRMAEELGIGTTDLDSAEILRLRREKITPVPSESTAGYGQPADPDHAEKPAAGSQYLWEEDHEQPRGSRLLDVSYAVEESDSCSACYANLTGALIRLREEGLLDLLHDRIGIGQGMQGKTGKLGVGRCTAGFETCIMGCPPDEEKIYRELKTYIWKENGQTVSDNG